MELFQLDPTPKKEIHDNPNVKSAFDIILINTMCKKLEKKPIGREHGVAKIKN